MTNRNHAIESRAVAVGEILTARDAGKAQDLSPELHAEIGLAAAFLYLGDVVAAGIASSQESMQEGLAPYMISKPDLDYVMEILDEVTRTGPGMSMHTIREKTHEALEILRRVHGA